MEQVWVKRGVSDSISSEIKSEDFAVTDISQTPNTILASIFSNWYKDSFKIQEKVYFCKCNNLEYVEYWSNNKGEYVNYEKEDIR